MTVIVHHNSGDREKYLEVQVVAQVDSNKNEWIKIMRGKQNLHNYLLSTIIKLEVF